MKSRTMTIGSRQLGESQPCFVLAEVASAHQGSEDRALRMIEAAFQMQADGIKFQLFRAEQLVVRRHPKRRDFEQIELSERSWRRILKQARASGLMLFIEAFDRPSLELAVEESVDALKIHTTDMENPDFIRAVGAAGRPIFFATGGVPEEALREALNLVTGPVGLLHGHQTFPTPVEETRLNEIGALKARFQVPVGFLDHTDGGTTFALVAPALAAALGADLVEKHFTLDRSEKGYDYHSSLNPEDFHRMVEVLRQAEQALSGGAVSSSEGARRYHRQMARSIIAAGLIARGDAVTAEHLAFKRVDPSQDPGLPPRAKDRIIGRRAVRPIQADEIIREDMLE
ncbi:MAG: N-acetylneuraminate synthase family protein [Vicinamibacteria bacterium]|nr:N-acetylneuraminate synthase family protein [Vicinamibacteria bacterium]